MIFTFAACWSLQLVLTHGVSLRATADFVQVLDHEVSGLG